MTKEQKKEEFIRLRIEGETFENIAKELGVSKQTLINWSKEGRVKSTIDMARISKYQSILKVYELNREAKVTFFAELINKVKEELLKRDISDYSFEKLFNVLIGSQKEVRALIPEKNFSDEDEFDPMNLVNPSYIFNPED